MRVDDVVLVIDKQLPRSSWPLGIIDSVHVSPDGLVRRVKVRTSKGILERAVNGLCFLEGDLELLK